MLSVEVERLTEEVEGLNRLVSLLRDQVNVLESATGGLPPSVIAKCLHDFRITLFALAGVKGGDYDPLSDAEIALLAYADFKGIE